MEQPHIPYYTQRATCPSPSSKVVIPLVNYLMAIRYLLFRECDDYGVGKEAVVGEFICSVSLLVPITSVSFVHECT